LSDERFNATTGSPIVRRRTEGSSMLVHLSIKGFALIDTLELSMGSGLTVLTGETGAGKSIVLDALSLAVGERARAEVIRAGEDQAEIAAQFALVGTPAKRVDQALEDAGLTPCDDGALVIRRLISRGGRHRQFINGSLATVSQLKTIVGPLVDFTGQHAQQALVRPGAALGVLDSYAGLVAEADSLADTWRRARELQREVEALLDAEREKVERTEWLTYQLNEIDEVAPEVGEDDQLASERARLKNTEHLQVAIGRALAAIVDDETGDALSRVQQATIELSRFEDDVELVRANEELEEAAALIDGVSVTLRRAAEQLGEDPERLDVVESRLDSIRRLTRKHGGSVEALLAAREKMAAELDTLENASERLEQLRAALAAEVVALGDGALKLRKKRKAAARRLAKGVEAELADLGMPGARFEIELTPLAVEEGSPLVVKTSDGRCGLGPRGADRAELLLSANPGEPGGPLARVASGGELSRVLLALKRVLLRSDPCPLSIFDEVDAGVGGAIGEVIGDKLKAVAAGRQVICVTHLPQIAAQADTHLKVQKRTDEGAGDKRTVAELNALADKERIEELSRMLGGKKITAKTRAHAREMLEAAG
jgi:DNA repair protein RecN (Recombination protein N)